MKNMLYILYIFYCFSCNVTINKKWFRKTECVMQQNDSKPEKESYKKRGLFPSDREKIQEKKEASGEGNLAALEVLDIGLPKAGRGRKERSEGKGMCEKKGSPEREEEKKGKVRGEKSREVGRRTCVWCVEEEVKRAWIRVVEGGRKKRSKRKEERR
jgi:hypothetical protein